MTTYVKSASSSQYHWCKNCSDYPSNIAHSTTVRPEGYLCDQCKSKQNNNSCTS